MRDGTNATRRLCCHASPTLVLAALLLGASFPTACQEAPDIAQDASAAKTEADAKEKSREALLEKGLALIQSRQPGAAIADSFDPLIADYEAQYSGGGKRVYSTRTMTEALLYMAMASKDNQGAIALGPTWAYAYFLKAYAMVELGLPAADTRPLLEKALALSPQNPQFLAELGHTYVADRNWPLMLATYERSEQATEIGSPEDGKTLELGRALRGQGYALVELGRLDEAEARYKKCLELDSNDTQAANELEYVRGLQSKR